MTVSTLASFVPSDHGNPALRASTFAGKRDLLDLLKRICRDVSADRYMLVDLVDRPNEPPRIIASNWIFDAIETIGMTVVGRIAGGLTGATGKAAALLAEDQRLLARHGHVEMVGLPLRAGNRRYALLLSAENAGSLVERALAKARLVCGYALSLLTPPEAIAELPGLLSERERECLYWVAEGKTTEEIALILGVSPNTANSYLSSAIQRLGARNRTLAVATAIRKGLI